MKTYRSRMDTDIQVRFINDTTPIVISKLDFISSKINSIEINTSEVHSLIHILTEILDEIGEIPNRVPIIITEEP